MPTVEMEVEIAQPPEIVAEAFLDPANAAFWTTDLDRFEVVSGEPGEVGSVAHLHYIQGGREYVMKDVLEEMIPNKYFRSSVSGNGLDAQIETWLQEVEGGTTVRIRWVGSGSSVPMRILLPLMRGRLLRQTRNELEVFKTLVEAHGAHFST